jgi:hypothetical protein
VKKHIPFTTQISYLEYSLNGPERDKVEAHLDQCSACREAVEATKQTLHNLHHSDLVEPEPSLIQRTLAAFRRQRRRLEDRPQRTAELAFDSWSKMAPVGVRHGGMPANHQMLFTENDLDLDVQVSKDETNGLFVLRGQLLEVNVDLTNLEGIEVLLIDPEGTSQRGLTDDLGQFTFSYLSQGTYTLQVALDDSDLKLEAIVIS